MVVLDGSPAQNLCNLLNINIPEVQDSAETWKPGKVHLPRMNTSTLVHLMSDGIRPCQLPAICLASYPLAHLVSKTDGPVRQASQRRLAWLLGRLGAETLDVAFISYFSGMDFRKMMLQHVGHITGFSMLLILITTSFNMLENQFRTFSHPFHR